MGDQPIKRLKMSVDRLVAFAATILQAFDIEDMDAIRGDNLMRPASCSLRATRVTLLRCTPSIWERNSCVKGKVSLLSRSRVCSNHRLSRSSSS